MTTKKKPSKWTPEEEQVAAMARSYGVAQSPNLSREEYRRRIQEALTGTDPESFAVNGKLGNREILKYHQALDVDSQRRGIKEFADVIQNNPSLWFDVLQPEIRRQATPTDPMDPGWPGYIAPWSIEPAPGVPPKVKAPERYPTEKDEAKTAAIESPWLSLKPA